MADGSNWLLSWLTNLNLPEYYSIFNHLGLQSRCLVVASVLDREKLNSIGIIKVGHVNRLIRAIEKLKDHEGGEVPPASISSTARKEPVESRLHHSINAPPVPQRRSVYRTLSSPISSLGFAANDNLQDSNCPPPVQPRDQSLKRMARQPVSSGFMLETSANVNSFMFSTTSVTVNGSQEVGNICTADQVQPPTTIERASRHPSPVPRRPSPNTHARTGSLSPKPCQKQILQPIPRKRWCKGKSPPSVVGNNVNSTSTLPAVIQLANGEGGLDLQSMLALPSPYPVPHASEKTTDYRSPTTSKSGDPVSVLGITPPNVSAESRDGLLPSLPPKKTSSPSMSPSQMYKTSLSDHPHPNLVRSCGSNLSPFPDTDCHEKRSRSPSPCMWNTPEDWGAHVIVRNNVPPKPPPRSSTLPVNKVSSNYQKEPLKDGLTCSSFDSLPCQPAEASGAIKFLSSQLEWPNSALSDSDDEEEENEAIMHTPITSTTVHDGGDTLLLPRQQQVTEESSDFENDKELKSFKSAPIHMDTMICQKSSGFRTKDHEDDIIWDNCAPQMTQPDPDYINQLCVNEIANFSSEEDEEENVRPLGSGTVKVIVTQRGVCTKDEDDEDDTLRMSIHSKKYDYINQETVDRIEVVSPMIRQQQHSGSDYINQVEVDRIEVVSPMIRQQQHSGSDYINQVEVDRIEVRSPMIRQQQHSGSDYINQVEVDRIEVAGSMIRQQQHSGFDCINQVEVDRIEVRSPMIRQQQHSGSDYINQVEVDRIEVAGSMIRQQQHSGFDCINQVEVDRIEVRSPMIRQQQHSGSDYINQVEVDRIEVRSPMIRQQQHSGSDCINQVEVDRIEVAGSMIRQQQHSGFDCINQVEVDRIEVRSPMIRQQQHSGSDYINQVEVDRIEVVSPMIRQQQPSGSDYINQVEVDRIEIAGSMIRQQQPSGFDCINQVEVDRIEVASPMIRQQQPSGSDYINQVEVDRIEIAGSMIRQQQPSGSDCINQVEVDRIEVVSPMIRQQQPSGSDYINHVEVDRIEVAGSMIRQQQPSGFDCINQVEVDRIEVVSPMIRQPDYINQVEVDRIEVASPMIRQQQPSCSDCMRQDTIDKRGSKGGDSDYMNQVVIDKVGQGPNSGEDFCEPINAMNKTTLVLVQSDFGGEGKKVRRDGEYMNQSVIDVTLRKGQGQVLSEEPYFTEDDFTTDDDDDDEDRIKICSRNRKRLQIRGTLKTGNMNKDYENQELLDGEIIPMMIAESGELMTCLREQKNCENLDRNGGGGGGEEGIFPLSRQTLAEVTSSGGNRSPNDSSSMDRGMTDGHLRSQVCVEDSSEATSLDFGCPRLPLSIPRTPSTSPQPLQSSSFSPTHHVLHSFANRSPIFSNPRSRMSVNVLSSPPVNRASKEDLRSTSPRSTDSDFLSKSNGFSSQSPFHRDIPSKLTRSVGTFSGTEFKRPEQLKRMLTEDSEELSRDKSSLTESSLLPGVMRLGSVITHDVPKTKEGFLFKKGGRRNERPWQKRWMTFNGSELKYFKNKTDKENLFLNAVELEKMFDVKRVADEVDNQYRFDLVVINRVFQFYSDSADDCQAWINVLHVAISKFKPQDHEHKEGGSMHSPDKQGYLHKQGHGAFSSKTFRERYVALKGSKFSYYESYDFFKMGRPIHTLEMCLSSVRPDMTSKVPRFLITMNNQKQYLFQASSDLDRQQWVEMLTMAIMTGIEMRPKTLPRGGTTKTTNNSQEVLMRVQENPANKTCADCSARDPVWGVINRGIMVCINCSGIHRSFGTHMSKVRSIELDEEVWKNENLIKLMVEIGNDNNNRFWEKHYQGERLLSTAEKEVRKNFIQAKYVTRSWIPTGSMETKDSLSRLLCDNLVTYNLLRTIELLALGANPCHLLSEVDDPEKSTPLAIARSSNQTLQAELLELNGASLCRKRQSFSVVGKKGHLYKTGSDRTGWKKRFCTLDQFRGFEYFKTEMGIELGNIHVDELLSVEKCEDEPSHDPRYRHCFEVNTQGRGYLFSAETESELEEWVATFQKIISSDAADNLGYDKVGYLKKKDSHSVTGWKKRWFTLRGKNLAFYRGERQELDEIDLRKVVEIKGPGSMGSPEQQCAFLIITDDKTYQLKADSQSEAESWVSALRQTQVSGLPLCDQKLTSNMVPIIVHKCLQFVESTGLDVEGLYRVSGEKAKIRRLILAFNQDAPGVVIDPEKYSVHDVTGTLKQFLRSLPDPLLTHALYQDFITTIQSEHEAQMYQMQNIIQHLPAVNRATLKRVILHLRRVVDNESRNKMSLSNITKLLGPTLMTVDGDPVSLENTAYEYTCIHNLIKFYKWLFHVEVDEEKREEAIEEAVQKIKEAEMLQKRRVELVHQKNPEMSSDTDFLTTIYLGMRDGETFNTNITGVTTVKEVVEKVVTCKGLSPDMYALYLVLGDTESHRVLCFSEILLAAMCSAGTDHFLCLKKNEFWEALRPHFGALSGNDVVQLYVKEKKRWKKYACTVKEKNFIQFKDSKCHNEAYKIGVSSFDIFAGIQQVKMDVKNPMPTRYGFWIKAMKGEDQSRYFCADKKEEILKIMAAVVKAKYQNCLQSPILPALSSSPPPSYSACTDSSTSPPPPPAPA